MTGVVLQVLPADPLSTYRHVPGTPGAGIRIIRMRPVRATTILHHIGDTADWGIDMTTAEDMDNGGKKPQTRAPVLRFAGMDVLRNQGAVAEFERTVMCQFLP